MSDFTDDKTPILSIIFGRWGWVRFGQVAGMVRPCEGFLVVVILLKVPACSGAAFPTIFSSDSVILPHKRITKTSEAPVWFYHSPNCLLDTFMCVLEVCDAAYLGAWP